MKIRLISAISACLLLTSCKEDTGNLPIIAEVEMGPLGRNALLSEACLHGTPYYLFMTTMQTGKPGSKGALAIRYNSDETIPKCSANIIKEEKPLVLQHFGEIKPSRNIGLLCINEISYYYVYNLYTAGLAPARRPDGSLVRCVN